MSRAKYIPKARKLVSAVHLYNTPSHQYQLEVFLWTENEQLLWNARILKFFYCISKKNSQTWCPEVITAAISAIQKS